ncbi:unnamed protein product [Hyaloperonospora brassicae]|uniref:t-SNARE coiled-coil homology domain-containing protein n=1 Tax=Hyaloperonospora brassicae TaxID=162125 RepID=A0AAV0UUV0_HYABA|nr:unnamed protein product [Hyaloperonospora brassicae]
MAANRTADFAHLCQHYSSLQGPTTLPRPVLKTALHETQQFTAAASDVSKEVFQASKRLQQLTQLVRQTNMFNDPTDAINELAALVKNDITAINTQLDNLQEYINSQREAAPSRQAATHSDAIVSLMKADLMATTRGFKDILEVRQENMKLQQSRRARYGKTASSALGKPLAFQASLPRATEVGSTTDSVEIQPLITTMTQEQLVAEQQNYTESRAEAVSLIESHIVDIGQLFGRLSTLINEQGDLVRRIDDNVEESLLTVSSGEHELLKYFSSLSNNRLLALKVSAILLIFLIFFMFFLA